MYVYDMCTGPNGNTWFGTNGNGVIRSKGAKDFLIYTESNGLPENYIRTLYTDKKDRLWMGTENNGAFYIQNDSVYQPIMDSKNDYYCRTITEDNYGRIWIATEYQGIFVIDESTVYQITEENGLLSDMVHSVHVTASDSIWIGTMKGINIFYQGQMGSLVDGGFTF